MKKIKNSTFSGLSFNYSTIQPFNSSSSPDTVIEVKNVSKKYCKSLKRSMIYGVMDIGRNMLGLSSHSERLRKGEFWAVDNVSFEVRRGETLGLIGPNGAGKTTLLKMLNGIFWPDKGKITVKGRVGALIAVGAGFHPLLTGRENVYINAAILGMTKEEVDRKFDEIVDFAEIGDFIDAPVKFYSSGMFVRLGFSVAVHCEPDILLVDEVLSVGDMQFQAKCHNKISEIKKKGTTIIIVSHFLPAISRLSDRVLYIKNGKIKFLGDAAETLDIYNRDMLSNTGGQKDRAASAFGSGRVKIKAAYFLNGQGQQIKEIATGESVIFALELISDYEGYLSVDIVIRGQRVVEYIRESLRPRFFIQKGVYMLELKLKRININNDLLNFIISIWDEERKELFDWHRDKYFLYVKGTTHSLGILQLDIYGNIYPLNKHKGGFKNEPGQD